jgi:hypothetical protein
MKLEELRVLVSVKRMIKKGQRGRGIEGVRKRIK